MITEAEALTLDEICAHTSLSSEEAALASKREYSEPFLFSDTSTQFDRLQRLVHNRRLKITRGGRFFHLIGQNDKGRAVDILEKVYAATYPDRKRRPLRMSPATPGSARWWIFSYTS